MWAARFLLARVFFLPGCDPRHNPGVVRFREDPLAHELMRTAVRAIFDYVDGFVAGEPGKGEQVGFGRGIHVDDFLAVVPLPTFANALRDGRALLSHLFRTLLQFRCALFGVLFELRSGIGRLLTSLLRVPRFCGTTQEERRAEQECGET